MIILGKFAIRKDAIVSMHLKHNKTMVITDTHDKEHVVHPVTEEDFTNLCIVLNPPKLTSDAPKRATNGKTK